MLEILLKMAIRITLFPVRPSKVLAAWGCRGLRCSVLFAHSTASSKPLVPIADGDLKVYPQFALVLSLLLSPSSTRPNAYRTCRTRGVLRCARGSVRVPVPGSSCTGPIPRAEEQNRGEHSMCVRARSVHWKRAQSRRLRVAVCWAAGPSVVRLARSEQEPGQHGRARRSGPPRLRLLRLQSPWEVEHGSP